MENRETILAELADLAPSIVAIGTNMPFSVEIGYFNHLSDTLLEKALFAESFGAPTNTYQLPANYFDNLTSQLLAKTSNAIPVDSEIIKEAKVVSFKQAKKWLNIAAAACIAVLLVSNAFLFTDRNRLKEYEKYRSMDIPSTLDLVSDTELRNYIENNDHSIVAEEMVMPDLQALPSVNEHIEWLSNDKINEYLQENKLLENTGNVNTIK